MASDRKSEKNATVGEPITRDDIEAGLRSFVGEAEKTVQSTARKMMPVVVGGGLLVLFVVYRLGKRVGTTKSTVVEIRRI
ncbi:MAG: hypothetical protein RIB98_10545 [Acidimicrobiales bacterium]